MVRRIWTWSPGWRLYGRPGAGIAVGAELAVLVADRLVAGVQLVEVVVRGLGEHDRRAPVLGVGVGGVECGVFGAGEVGAGVDARAGGVAADRELVVAVAEAGLVAAVGGVVGAEVAGQNGLAVLVAGGGLEVGPESAGADGRVLVRVADGDQPRAGGLDRGEEGVLFAGGGECGFVVDDRRLRPEDDRAVGDRGLERGERVVASVDAGVREDRAPGARPRRRRCW